MPYVLALDQGTTSSRAILFDAAGNPKAWAQHEFAQHFPQNGWVEHDPADIWSAQLRAIQDTLSSAGAELREIAAIGITNQRETTVMWERSSGRPISRAIVWQDRRTAPLCERLRASGAERLVAQKTGLLLDPYFSATKIAWLLDNVDGLRRRAERSEIAFGTVDSWLVWNLTGGAVHATDHTNASRTLLLNVETLQWDDELLELFAIPRSVLPELRTSVGDFGTCDPRLFGASIPIRGVAGDQQAALIGQAGFAEGIAKNTYGTGSFVVLNTGPRIVRSRNGLLSTVAYTQADRKTTYALEGSIFVTGAAVQWLRDGLQLISRASDVETLAASVPDSGGVYFVPALAGMGAPHWDPHARGAIFGLTRATTRAHLARATLDAMAYQTADVVDAMQSDSGTSLRELRVDGGACVNDLAMQFQADILGTHVVRPRVTETTALGAAYLAGLSSGLYADMEAIEKLWTEQRRFTPSIGTSKRAELLAGWRDAVSRTTTESRRAVRPR